MSDNVGSVIFWSGVVDNLGVAVGIASPSVFVQKLFPLPVSTSGFHFRFPLPVSWPTFELPMSDNVGSVIFGSGMVENVG